MSANQLTYTEAWLAGPQSTKFYTRTYTPASLPPKAAVVFLHGFAEHIGRYTHFHPILAARGIAVFTYDQRGFGLTAQDTGGNKSKSSSYGKTSWKDQMADIEWAVGHTRKTFENVPLFLMGHSMGGAEALGFGTQGDKGCHVAALQSLSGIIATSPLIEQATPAPKIAKWIGGKLSVFLPSFLIPAAVKAEDLTHDSEITAAYLKDPLVHESGSLKGIHDMLSKGEWLLHSGCTYWPKDLPVLLIHGTEDKVTSHKASQAFYDRLAATKKKISLFPGGYHELHNEPEGVKDKLADEIIAFIEDNLAPSAAAASTSEMPAQPVKEAEATEPIPPTDAGPEPTGISSTRAKM